MKTHYARRARKGHLSNRGGEWSNKGRHIARGTKQRGKVVLV